jgi:hypothetical protein
VRRLTISLATLAILAFTTGSAQAATDGAVKATWGDTTLVPGGEGQFTVQVRNIGTQDFEPGLTITEELPPGVKATKITWGPNTIFELCEGIGWPACEAGFGITPTCTGIGTETVTCELSAFDVLLLEHGKAPGLKDGAFLPAEPTGYLPTMYIDVEVDSGASGTSANTVTLSGGGAPTVSDTDQISFGGAQPDFDLVSGSYEADIFEQAFPFGERSRQAGDHPFEERVNFDLNAKSGISPTDGTRETLSVGLLRTVELTLPRGLVGNPETLPKCDPTVFAQGGVVNNATGCPANTQVGYLNIPIIVGATNNGRANFPNVNDMLTRVAIYNLEPPKGTPVDLGFFAGGVVQGHIYATLDPAQNYAIKSITPNISSVANVRGSEVTIWGVPGDPAHDKFRYFTEVQPGDIALGAPFTAPIRPFFTSATDCDFDNGGQRIRIDSYQNPDDFTGVQEDSHPLNVTGCEDPRFRFEPDVSLQPTVKDAGAPTGLDVNLENPLRDDTVDEAKKLYAENGFVKGISTPPMKKVVVTFPEGMTLNPAAAQGLASCSPSQIGLGTNDPVTCPDASQYGKLTLHTPALPVDEQPEGFVYIAKQNDNPFHNFLSLYLVIQQPDRGILVKLPGRADLDPVSGQITTTFDDLPQFPVSNMEMNLKGGLRAGLVNPQTCGKKTIEATFFSWHEPTVPKTVNSNFVVTQNPDGTPCLNSPGDRPFEPQLSGGTVNNLAGAFSPMELRMTRTDLEQELSVAEGTAPPGLLASIKGVGRCSDAAIAQAAARESGIEEQNNPSCPASSLVGSVDAGAGVGQVLTYVKGKIYLAGPYKGAPVSGVAIVPAVAGPFDLGTIVTRAPGYVNPKTAELQLRTDPLPLIFKGIPVRVRDIQVHLDRPNFTLNPTNCDRFSLDGTLFSSEGKSKASSTPFQAAECAGLGFKPRLTARLFGGTKRGAHPKFRGLFKARSGDANVSGAVVTLPRSEFLDQSHIRTVCTRVQFAADACPSGAIYGHAVAKTPLLDEELKGPVYLRSSDNKLPDLVADLHGIIDVEVSGRIDSIRGGIRTTFESIPDAPVESFEIIVQGGRKGVLVNSRDICARTYRLNAEFSAQNGKETTLRPKLQANCKANRKAKRR